MINAYDETECKQAFYSTGKGPKDLIKKIGLEEALGSKDKDKENKKREQNDNLKQILKELAYQKGDKHRIEIDSITT